MCFKKQYALALTCFFCTSSASAQALRKTTSSIEDLEFQQAKVSRIDTIKIDHSNDPGNLHIQSLLDKHLNSPRIEMENNEYVQEFLSKFSSSRYQTHLGKMLGLSKYYFPIFEQALSKVGVPTEIKYLAIIESSLNPNAVSRMGATGPWQFMYTTAKEHGLTINSYVDERKDPVSSSYAAANYLKESYNIYQDWLLAIASYNCGRGNVNKAISRSGLANPNFWEIRRFLPRETQNYIPAFIAMHQVLENQQVEIIPQETPFPFQTDHIMVDREVSLSAVSNALSVPESTILALNPAYKRKVIQGSKEHVQRLVVPAINKADYSKLYAALHGENTISTTMNAASFASNAAEKNLNKLHQVRKGENLEKIALQYQVTIQDLKVWNNLKNHIIVPGQKLKIVTNSSSTTKEKQYITYKVKRGDNLSKIANRYKNTSVNQLKAMNNLKGNVLKVGMTLKISEI